MSKFIALPVDNYRDEIVSAIRDHQVVVITAETGAGKSTRVPRFLLEDGRAVIVTQPRRLAARTVAERVAEEVGTPLGEIVGFRTAHERQDGPKTKVLFCTDGLQLVRELSDSGPAAPSVLVLDEVHEWNLNMEVLVAWAKRRVADEPNFRVVLMSATLEAAKLAEFFGGEVPVISVPGRTYPVEMREGADLTVETTALAKAGRNTLVFVPGKAEIEKALAALRQTLGETAELIPLHGGLDSAEQRRAFAHYPRPKVVVATNVAQTSVTIDDIDAVVDGGLERRTEVRDGVEGLYLGEISQADCRQRAGRAGRTKAGVYVLCSRQTLSTRPEFPTAEIERSRLDQTVLRLAVAGLDATKLQFFHQPAAGVLADAKLALERLGALNATGQATKIGRQMSRLPVSVNLARMVIEAERRGCLSEVLTIAACIEAGGLRDRSGTWRALTDERTSDLLAELDCYNAASALKGGQAMRDAGLFAKAVFRAREIRGHLVRAIETKPRPGDDHADRKQLLKACVAGMVDHLYRNDGYGGLRNGGGQRELARESVVARNAPWITGVPFDLAVASRRGGTFTIHLVTNATAVDPAWLIEVAPQLVATAIRNYRYDRGRGAVVVDEVTIFNGQETEIKAVEAPSGVEATEALVQALAYGYTGHSAEAHNAAVRATLNSLCARSEGKVQPLSDQQLRAYYVEKISGCKSLAEIAELELSLNLDDYAPAEIREEIDRQAPPTIEVLGQLLPVTYQTGYAPKVTLPRELVDAGTWKELPDEGVLLPGGRAVTLEVVFGSWNNATYQTVLLLKAGVREYLNQKQWSSWTDRPEIALPVVTEESAEISPITEVAYGTDVLTGQPLMAFGTVAYNTNHYYSYGPYFRASWFQTQAEAETVRAQAVAKIDEIKVAVIAQQQLAEAKVRAEAVRRQASGLYNEHYRNLTADLRSRLSSYYVPSSTDPAVIEAWIATVEALVAEAQAILADQQRVREQAEAERIEREAAVARKLAKLTSGAEKLRAEAVQVLDQSGDDLSDAVYNRVLAVADSQRLSGDPDSLGAWIAEATAALAAAKQELTKPSSGGAVSSADLAALAERFKKH